MYRWSVFPLTMIRWRAPYGEQSAPSASPLACSSSGISRYSAKVLVRMRATSFCPSSVQCISSESVTGSGDASNAVSLIAWHTSAKRIRVVNVKPW